MLTRLQQAIQRHASGPTILVLLGLVVAFAVILNLTSISFGSRALMARAGGLCILDMRTHYTPDEAYTLFEALGTEGRRLYACLLLVADILFPVVAMLLGVTSIAWFMRHIVAPHHPAQRLILVPPVMLTADLAENTSILTMMLIFPRRLDSVARLACFFTMLKGSAGLITVTVIVACAAILAWQRIVRGYQAGGDRAT